MQIRVGCRWTGKFLKILIRTMREDQITAALWKDHVAWEREFITSYS